MILLSILAIIFIIVAVVLLLVVGTGAAILIVPVMDILVCVFLIIGIAKLIKKLKRK